MLILPLSILTFIFCAPRADEWKKRNVYQLLVDRFSNSGSKNSSKNGCSDLHTWCGGTYDGITNNLDYIKNMGFNAIWISPVVQSFSYHGYDMQDMLRINERYGGENGLRNLIQKAHEKDIWIMADIVLNHAGAIGTDFQKINPFNSADHYHDWIGITNGKLKIAADLKQENNWVKEQLFNWAKSLRDDYKIDGFRLDTTPEVPQWCHSQFKAVMGDYYITGEVFNGNVKYVAGYANILRGALSYPQYFAARDVFGKGRAMSALSDVKKDYAQLVERPDLLSPFVDNHDNARFLNSCNNYNMLKNYIVQTLLDEGVAIMYYGTEQGFSGGADPDCREWIGDKLNTQHELYQFVRSVLSFKNAHTDDFSKPFEERYVRDNLFAFSRGMVYIITTNQENKVDVNTEDHPYSDNTHLCDALSEYQITLQGKSMQYSINYGHPIVFYPC